MHKLVATPAKPGYLAQSTFFMPSLLKRLVMHDPRHKMMPGELELVTLAELTAAIVLCGCLNVKVYDWVIQLLNLNVFVDI